MRSCLPCPGVRGWPRRRDPRHGAMVRAAGPPALRLPVPVVARRVGRGRPRRPAAVRDRDHGARAERGVPDPREHRRRRRRRRRAARAVGRRQPAARAALARSPRSDRTGRGARVRLRPRAHPARVRWAVEIGGGDGGREPDRARPRVSGASLRGGVARALDGDPPRRPAPHDLRRDRSRVAVAAHRRRARLLHRRDVAARARRALAGAPDRPLDLRRLLDRVRGHPRARPDRRDRGRHRSGEHPRVDQGHTVRAARARAGGAPRCHPCPGASAATSAWSWS